MRNLKIPRLTPGTPAIQFVTILVEENPEIEAVRFLRYKCPMAAQDREILSEGEHSIIREALRLRDKTRLPFWDSVFTVLLTNQHTGSVDGLLKAAVFHQPHKGGIACLTRAEILEGHIVRLLESSISEYVIALHSRIRVAGKDLHLPLMDFHVPESAIGDRIVVATCRVLFDFDVAVFSSGKSYHAYGLTLVDNKRLRQILARAVLVGPVIDKNYVAHQLLENACTLRLGMQNGKATLPTFRFLVGKLNGI